MLESLSNWHTGREGIWHTGLSPTQHASACFHLTLNFLVHGREGSIGLEKGSSDHQDPSFLSLAQHAGSLADPQEFPSAHREELHAIL